MLNTNGQRQSLPQISCFDEISEKDWEFYLQYEEPRDLLELTRRILAEENRFFVDERFQKLLYCLLFGPQSRYQTQKFLEQNAPLFRARIYRETDIEERVKSPEKYGEWQGYDKEGSGAPRHGETSSGRINPRGISYLYMASDVQTSIQEVRAQPGEYVSVAPFMLKERCIFFDLTKGFSFLDVATTERSRWINGLVLALEGLFQRPESRIGSYHLCQYISEFVKLWGLDGVMYRSSHVQNVGVADGINYAIFYPSKFEAISSRLYYAVENKVELVHV